MEKKKIKSSKGKIVEVEIEKYTDTDKIEYDIFIGGKSVVNSVKEKGLENHVAYYDGVTEDGTNVENFELEEFSRINGVLKQSLDIYLYGVSYITDNESFVIKENDKIVVKDDVRYKYPSMENYNYSGIVLRVSKQKQKAVVSHVNMSMNFDYWEIELDDMTKVK